MKRTLYRWLRWGRIRWGKDEDAWVWFEVEMKNYVLDLLVRCLLDT